MSKKKIKCTKLSQCYFSVTLPGSSTHTQFASQRPSNTRKLAVDDANFGTIVSAICIQNLSQQFQIHLPIKKQNSFYSQTANSDLKRTWKRSRLNSSYVRGLLIVLLFSKAPSKFSLLLGFVSSGQEKKIYRLVKWLYGLKQVGVEFLHYKRVCFATCKLFDIDVDVELKKNAKNEEHLKVKLFQEITRLKRERDGRTDLSLHGSF